MKGGVSPHFGPHVISEDNASTARSTSHFSLALVCRQGTLRNDPTNANAPRTIDATCLKPVNDDQCGHACVNLATGKKIRPGVVFELPVNDAVIKCVEAMAEAPGIKSLKLQNHLKTRFCPTDQIAGVDCEESRWSIKESPGCRQGEHDSSTMIEQGERAECSKVTQLDNTIPDEDPDKPPLCKTKMTGKQMANKNFKHKFPAGTEIKMRFNSGSWHQE